MFKNLKLHYILISLLLLVFFALTIPLFRLQLIAGEQYKEIAQKNFVRIKKTKPIRGQIFDRKYRPIVLNKPSVNLYFIPGLVKNKNNLAMFISQSLNVDQQDIYSILHNNRYRTYQEILLLQDIKHEDMIKISEHSNEYPSILFKTETIRSYELENHFTGYVGKISDKEYEKLRQSGYSYSDMIGKGGIEKYYESLLKGKSGYQVIQVDAKGKNLGFFKHNLEQPAINGLDLILHIDLDLQNYIYEEFPDDINGAVVVMDVLTGGVMAYVSHPCYDPNIFAGPIPYPIWDSLMTNQNKPMLDRIIHGTYPPGSIIKPLIGSLALDYNLVGVNTKLESCTGGMQIGNRFFKCWFSGGHGRVNLEEAITYSCDVYFYDLSSRFTLQELRDYALENFLFGKTGIDLPNERLGFFPDENWYRKNYGRYVSILGQKVNLAIGQGEMLTTPLEMCSYYTALANQGKWKTPHLLEKTLGEQRLKYHDLNDEEFKELKIKPETMKVITRSLKSVVYKPYGTGHSAQTPGVVVYGKTGSAENHQGKDTHAWFAGYAKWEEPEIAFVVFMENAGHGGSVAAPFAQKIISYYQRKVRSSS